MENAINIFAPRFADEVKAREHLEAINWPQGPYCPHCGSFNATRLQGGHHRAGLIQCNDCRKQYTVTVGTVFERSKVALNKWLLVNHLLCASKKGMSAHQIARMIGVSYKTAWFMMHRIREAMRDNGNDGPMGGENETIEVDETYVGGKSKNRAFKSPPKKEAVVALVQRDGKVKGFHVKSVTHKTLKPILYKHIDRATYLMTDQALVYKSAGKQFSGHGRVNHSINEYVRGVFWHTNTVENYFSILKRGIVGVYHHVSEAHLKRYVGEFDFRYNTRDISDAERADKALQGIVGKRLTYRRTDTPAFA